MYIIYAKISTAYIIEVNVFVFTIKKLRYDYFIFFKFKLNIVNSNILRYFLIPKKNMYIH